MADPTAWSFDPAENRTIRRLALSQLFLVDSWALLGAGLLLLSALVPTGIGPLAGFVTVLIAIGRVVTWVESDRAWLDGIDDDLEAIGEWNPVPDRTRARLRTRLSELGVDPTVIDRFGRDNRRVLAPACAILLGVVGYAVGYAIFGAAVVAVPALAGLVVGLFTNLHGRGQARGEIDPDGDRVTYRDRTRSLSSVTDWWTIPVGAVTLLRCRGPAGLDEPTWLAIPTERTGPVAMALAVEPETGTDTRTERDDWQPADWQHRFGPKLAIVAVGVSLVAIGGGLAASQVRPETTSSLVRIAIAGAAVTVAVTIALLVGVLRGRARRR